MTFLVDTSGPLAPMSTPPPVLRGPWHVQLAHLGGPAHGLHPCPAAFLQGTPPSRAPALAWGLGLKLPWLSSLLQQENLPLTGDQPFFTLPNWVRQPLSLPLGGSSAGEPSAKSALLLLGALVGMGRGGQLSSAGLGDLETICWLRSQVHLPVPHLP